MSPVEWHLVLWLWTAGIVGAVYLAALAVALLRPPSARARRRRWPRVVATLSATTVAGWLFLVGFRGYVDAAVAPGEALVVTANAERWHWSFTYPDGKTVDDGLRIPAGKPVRVDVRTRDLDYRFDVPSLHVSAAAGADGSAWFVARKAGEQPILCGAACNGHPEMATTLTVLDAQAWDDFTDDGSKLPAAEYGAKLYVKSMCKTCHSLDGTPGTAPSFKGIFGKRETLADGSTVLVDEAYVKESILTPSAKVVKGFQPVMPPFAGQLNDKQIEALVAFVKTVQK
jgi:cytochrome c oxidase subunit 2